jgi:hypothetical protein
MAADDDTSPVPVGAPKTGQSAAGEIDRFLGQARQLEPVAAGRAARLIFALDATMSRQPTWDLATQVQAEMFAAAAAVGGLSVQLVYYRGFGECRASRFTSDAGELGRLMSSISVRGGRTQIGRVLSHARQEAARGPVAALVFVGDAFEEPIDEVCARAGELALLGVKGFMFHEGHDPAAAAAFAEIARLTNGAALRFDASAPRQLGDLLRAVAAFASGGRPALDKLAVSNPDARRLLSALRR